MSIRYTPPEEFRVDQIEGASPEQARFDEAVRDRAALVEQARRILGTESRFDGLANLEIKRQVVAHVFPTLALTSEKRVTDLYDAAIYEGPSCNQRFDAVGGNSKDLMTQVRRNQIYESRDAWKTPLRHSKDEAPVTDPVEQLGTPGGGDLMTQVRREQLYASRDAWKKPLG